MSFHVRRRQQFFEAVGDGLVLMFAAPQRFRSRDTDYPYRADAHLFHLTGCDLPGVAALFDVVSGTGRFHLFIPPYDAKRARWDGPTPNTAEAQRLFGADSVAVSTELPRVFQHHAGDHQRLLFAFDHYPEHDDTVYRWIEAVRLQRDDADGVVSFSRIDDPRPLIDRLRSCKDDHAIEMMRAAARVTVDAFHQVIAEVQPGVREYAMAALMDYACRCGGATPAFQTIAAAGSNATILHYRKNRDLLRSGDLLLIDAGCEMDYYCADVSRTVPISGKFSPVQRRVYEVVLAAQQQAIAAMRPGVTLYQLQKMVERALAKGLQSLGLMQGVDGGDARRQRLRQFFPHRFGHFIGLDVHDPGRWDDPPGRPVPLQAGMVLTVEPGLYFPDDDDVPAELRGVGVRIEDTVLVTNAGCQVLTDRLPKQVDELEALVGVSTRSELPV